MIVICFEINSGLLGGFGDRIVGLVSCRLIAKVLNKEFSILWNKENIKEYFDYSKYDFELKNIEKMDVKRYYGINSENTFEKYLRFGQDLFPNKINKMYLNMNIANWLYLNVNFKDQNLNYIDDILNEYKHLYDNILKPTDIFLNKVKNFVQDKKHIIGIQIRTGDVFMKNNSSAKKKYRYKKFKDIDNIDTNILLVLKTIKSHIINIHKDETYSVFITSDYDNIYNIGLNVWDKDQIIYNTDPAQHLDRNIVNSDFSKIFVDNYILSQKSDILYMSDYSNYGVISGLMCKHDNIYNLDCNKIEKKSIIKKKLI